MENFVFKNTTAIIFGKDTLSQVGQLSKPYGKKVLLVYGEGFVKMTGILDKVKASLAKEGLEIIEFPGAMPNPVLSHVQKGIALCKEKRADFILAVGGGSVIDVAKAIGVGALYDGDVWDLFDMVASVKETLPVGVVLTVPGTGSESSNSSVVTNEWTLVKRGLNDDLIRPVFAIMDPELSYSLSSYQTACGVADAMSHVMERYFSATENVDCTDRMCEALLLSLIKNGPLAISKPNDYNARAEILLASKFAHDNTVGVGRTGDFSTHRIAHQLSAFYGMTHGASVALIFIAWMSYVYKHDLNRFVQFAVRVWGVNPSDYLSASESNSETKLDFEPSSKSNSDSDQSSKTAQSRIAQEGIRRTADFFKNLGLELSLSEAGVPTSSFHEMAEKATSMSGGVIGNFIKLNTNDVEKIYNLAK
jgi:alcohol dehydrogenase